MFHRTQSTTSSSYSLINLRLVLLSCGFYSFNLWPFTAPSGHRSSVPSRCHPARFCSASRQKDICTLVPFTLTLMWHLTWFSVPSPWVERHPRASTGALSFHAIHEIWSIGQRPPVLPLCWSVSLTAVWRHLISASSWVQRSHPNARTGPCGTVDATPRTKGPLSFVLWSASAWPHTVWPVHCWGNQMQFVLK